MNQAKLDRIDWLKLDTQGTDLDLLKSLAAAQINQLLAVDIEPGVTAFYHDENRFSETHEFMLSRGFWLADLSQQKFPRISLRAIDSARLGPQDIERLNRNPFAFELPVFKND